MGSTFFRKLPTPMEIKTMYPVPEKVENKKKENDAEIRKLFTGESDNLLLSSVHVQLTIRKLLRTMWADLQKSRKK